MSFISLTSFESENMSATNSIFFIETESPVSLTGRKLCSVESAALKNPHRKVYFLINTEKTWVHLPRR